MKPSGDYAQLLKSSCFLENGVTCRRRFSTDGGFVNLWSTIRSDETIKVSVTFSSSYSVHRRPPPLFGGKSQSTWDDCHPRDLLRCGTGSLSQTSTTTVSRRNPDRPTSRRRSKNSLFRLAKENRSWSYLRMRGLLSNLGRARWPAPRSRHWH